LYDKGSELALEGISHEADSEQAHRAEDCSETGEQPRARQIAGKLIWAIYDRGRKRINVASKLPQGGPGCYNAYLIRLAYEEEARSMFELPGSSARRRFTLKSLENLLLAIAVIAGAAVGIHALISGSSPSAPDADAVPPNLSATRSGQADASAPVFESPASSDKRGDELRAQLAQAMEQLKTSQGRISQLEAQLKQAPSAADLDDARKEIGDLRSQLSAAKVIVEGRKSQIEAAKSSPPGTPAKAVVARANDETSADVSMLLNRGDALLSTGDIASGRLFYQRAAEAGNGQAALRLGNTYDPAFLERAQMRVHGDGALALFWYQRARELGAGEAEILLKGVQTQSER
jgi:hypothetical protein